MGVCLVQTVGKMQAGRLVDTNSSFQKIKFLLDEENEICKHTTDEPNLRKMIDRLKRENNYTIYRNICACGLAERQHFSYEKDWAGDYGD